MKKIWKAIIIFYDDSFLPVFKTFSSINEENLKKKKDKTKEYTEASLISKYSSTVIVNTYHEYTVGNLAG